jgi:hypothetical protein
MIGQDIEDRRDDALLGAAPDRHAIGARADDKAKRIEQNRFARAGFARQNGKARRQRKARLINEHKILNMERGEHPQPDLSAAPPIYRNLPAAKS